MQNQPFQMQNPSTVPSMQSTLFLPHCPVGWALLRGIETPQNWIVAGQEGDVLKPNRLKRFSLLLPNTLVQMQTRNEAKREETQLAGSRHHIK